MAKTILFYCPEMKELAAVVAERSLDIELGTVSWNRFEDDFPYLKIEDVKTVQGRNVAFLACFSSPETILEQLAVMQAIPRYGAGSFRVVLPYFPTATMERIRREGEIATAKTLARLLSVTPLSRNGPAEIVFFDIHALQERFYFADSVIPILLTAVPLLIERLTAFSNVAIAFPDEGAWKRFSDQFEAYDHILCHKVRQGTERVVTIKEGDPENRHVVIVDDLVKTGGTILECASVLKAAGAGEVSAYVTHGVFPRESWQRFIDAGFTHVWITDSCPKIAQTVSGRAPFEVLSLASLIDDYLSDSHS